MKIPKLKVPTLQIPGLHVKTTLFDALCFALGLRMQQLALTQQEFKHLLEKSDFSLHLSTPNEAGRVYVLQSDGIKQMPSEMYHKKYDKLPDLTVQFRSTKAALNVLLRADAALFKTAVQTGLIKLEGDKERIRWLMAALSQIKPTDIRKIGMEYILKAQKFLSK